jgi:hypothetical protein
MESHNPHKRDVSRVTGSKQNSDIERPAGFKAISASPNWRGSVLFCIGKIAGEYVTDIATYVLYT